jgi:HlyD family secretion protein
MHRIRKHRKWLVPGTVGLLAGVLVWQKMRTPALDVETALIAHESMRVTIDEEGRTRALDRSVVTAPVSGRLQRISVRAGDRISAGQMLAQIEPLLHDLPARAEADSRLQAAQARQRAANAELAQAKARHEQATRELARRAQLVQAGALSVEQIEQYELATRASADAVRNAQEGVTIAAAEVNAARQSQASHREQSRAAVQMRAPASGIVLRVREYSARTVTAGEPLLELGEVSTLEAVIDVLTADAVRIRPGMRVLLTGWGGEPLSGRVRTIEPSAFTRLSALGVEEQRVNVLADFDHCPETLGDGYRIEGSIVVWSADRVLTVPNTALFRAAEGWRTFVVASGRAELRTVQIGQRSNESSEILSGLAEGERVILFPGDRLTAGARVKYSAAGRRARQIP